METTEEKGEESQAFLVQNIPWMRNRLLSVLGLDGEVLVVGRIQEWHL